MELEQLLPELSDWQEIWDVWERKSGAGRKQKFIDLRAEDELTDKMHICSDGLLRQNGSG